MEFRKNIKVKCKESHTICEVYDGKLMYLINVLWGSESYQK